MNPDIFIHLKTLDAFYDLKTALMQAQSSMYRTEGSQVLLNSLLASYPYLSDLSLTAENLSEVIKQLTAQVGGVELIRAQLTVEPTDALITHMYDIFKTIVKRPFLIEVSINKDILGGVFVEIGGKQHDFSLLRLVKEEIHTNNV